MTAVAAPITVPPLAVCRVRESLVVHLVRHTGAGFEPEALCGGTVEAGRPERPLVRSPCGACVRTADDQGLGTVRDLTSAWVNLRRLAVWLRAAA